MTSILMRTSTIKKIVEAFAEVDLKPILSKEHLKIVTNGTLENFMAISAIVPLSWVTLLNLYRTGQRHLAKLPINYVA